MSIVENIKALRTEKGIPQKVLADALNVDIAVISNIENGKRELKVSELEIISNTLEVEIIDLFTYPEKYVKLTDASEEIEATLQIRLKKPIKDELLRLLTQNGQLKIS